MDRTRRRQDSVSIPIFADGPHETFLVYLCWIGVLSDWTGAMDHLVEDELRRRRRTEIARGLREKWEERKRVRELIAG